MEQKTGSLRQRIQKGKVSRADVIRRLAELAFGKANDCVRLALEQLAAATDEDGAQAEEFLRALAPGQEQAE